MVASLCFMNESSRHKSFVWNTCLKVCVHSHIQVHASRRRHFLLLDILWLTRNFWQFSHHLNKMLQITVFFMQRNVYFLTRTLKLCSQLLEFKQRFLGGQYYLRKFFISWARTFFFLLDLGSCSICFGHEILRLKGFCELENEVLKSRIL